MDCSLEVAQNFIWDCQYRIPSCATAASIVRIVEPAMSAVAISCLLSGSHSPCSYSSLVAVGIPSHATGPDFSNAPPMPSEWWDMFHEERVRSFSTAAMHRMGASCSKGDCGGPQQRMQASVMGKHKVLEGSPDLAPTSIFTTVIADLERSR